MKKSFWIKGSYSLCSLKLDLKMKLTILFGVFSFFQLQAFSSYGQKAKVSLDMKETPIERVFKEIESQTEFRFFYNVEDLDANQIVSIKASRKNIDYVLKRLLKNSGIQYKVVDRQIVLAKLKKEIPPPVSLNPTNEVPQHIVSGTVTDKDGTPLPGASIVQKGTTNGTQSDFDGNFSIEIEDGNGTLVISYIGFATQEVPISNRTSLAIVLQEDAAGLDEVVVVGYGSQKKINLTGSVSTISIDNIASRPVTNISSGLSGLAPGVLVTQSNGGLADGDGAVIRIRGIGTFNDSNPLVVVDGVPSGDTSIINDIDPNDIENISILKDAASASIYGSRGANGVVLITTKKGKSGKLQVQYNSYAGFQKAFRKVDYVSDFALYMEQANINRGLEIFDPVDIQEWRDNPNDPLAHPNVNWYEEQIGRSATIQSHSLAFRGGSEATTYSFSLNYLDQDGLRPGNNLKRYGLRLNLSSEVVKGLNVGGNLFFRWSDVEGSNELVSPGSSGTGDVLANNVIDSGWVPGIPTIQDDQGRWGDAQHPAVGTVGNLYADLENKKRDKRSQRVLGDVFASYEIVEGLTATAKLALNFNNSFKDFFNGRYELWNFRSNTLSREIGADVNRKVTFKSNQDYLLTGNFLLEYGKTFGVHDIKVLGGYESLQFREDNVSATISNLPSDNVPTIDAGLENPSVEGNIQKWGLLSYFGRFNYAYDNKYLFEANFRADGSSRFRDGKRWGYFPAFSLGWVVSQEQFMQESEVFDYFKLRASWGKLGNNRIGIYPYQSTYSLNQNYSFGGVVYSGIAQNRLVDPDIQWETTTSTDLGFDARLFNGKMDITFDYFHRETDNILNELPIPQFLGGKEEPTVNLAAMVNKGFELSLGHNGSIGALQYRISGHVTQTDNEVTDYFEDIQTGGIQIGLPFNSFWGLEAVGIFKTQEQLDAAATHADNTALGDIEFKDQLTVDTNGDGVPDEADGVISLDDRTFIGNRIPKYTYGGNISLGYKGFDFSALFQGVANRDVNVLGAATQPIGALDRGNLPQKWVDEAWSAENPSGTLPRLNSLAFNGLNNDLSTFWVKDVSFLRVKNVQLGYSFSNTTLDRMGMSKLRVYVSSDNPFVLTNEEWGVDPETADYRGVIPNTTTFILGLNVGF